MSDIMKRYEIENQEEWREWIKKIPTIQFKQDWNVKIIPPFGGAMARFCVELNGANVSVYLDVSERLGYFGEPYWEIYPFDDDVYRIAMDNAEELVQKISESLDKQNKTPLQD